MVTWWSWRRRWMWSPAEAKHRARFRLGCLFLPVLGRCSGFKRGEQTLRDLRDVFDCGVEGRLVCLGRLVKASYLPHVLQGSGLYLLIGCRWCEVEKCLDVPTHKTRPPD